MLTNGYREMNVKVPFKPGKQRIDGLYFHTLWGNDSTTNIIVRNLWSEGTTRIEMVGDTSNFKVTNICYAGGSPRLYDGTGNSSLSEATPNPASDAVAIEYDILENGTHSLIVYNSEGKIFTTLFDEYKQRGSYSLKMDVTNMPTGTYYYILQTPTRRLVRSMVKN
jgi:hypothetical protein